MGPISIIGSSDAVVLINFHEGSYTTVAKDGSAWGRQGPTMEKDAVAEKDHVAAAGFAGQLVKVPATAVKFGLFVRDSSSFVVSDFYLEGGDQIVYLSGRLNGSAAGRVTMSCVRHPTSTSTRPPLNKYQPEFVEIDHYRGAFAHTAAVWNLHGYPEFQSGPPGPPPVDPPFEVVQTGSEPIDLCFFGESYCDSPPRFVLDTGAQLSLIGNSIDSVYAGSCGRTPAAPNLQKYCSDHGVAHNFDLCVLEDKAAQRAAEAAGEALDHLRVLGRWDLYLNFAGPPPAAGFF